LTGSLMDVAEAKSLAAVEGLELVPSASSASGYKGVVEHNRKYQAISNKQYLGHFATKAEAALAYARAVGPQRSAMEAAEARGEGPPRPNDITAEEAEAKVRASGLTLEKSSCSATGYKGVSRNTRGFQAQVCVGGKRRKLGTFATVEAAALAIAEDLAGCEVELAATRGAPQPLTQQQARDVAAAEGLLLVQSSKSGTGFKNVCWLKRSSNYGAKVYKDGQQCDLGTFATAEEAALAYARAIGKERAATEASIAMVEVRDPLTAAGALEAAAGADLELLRSPTGGSGFVGVHKNNGGFQARVSGRHIGTFKTKEEAALERARVLKQQSADALAAACDASPSLPPTAEDVRDTAKAEGIELVESSNVSGFRGVHKRGDNKFRASIHTNGKMRHLGQFSTAEEAALAYARAVGKERAATEASIAMVEVRDPLTAAGALEAAAGAYLELLRSPTGGSVEEAAARVEVREPLTAEEAMEAAAHEGLTLLVEAATQI